MRKIISAVLVFFIFFQSPNVIGQDLLTTKDLSTLRVDNLSETEISKIKTQLQINNLTIEQAESMALAKGMTAIEFAKLKLRLDALQSVSAPALVSDKNANQNRTQKVVENIKVKNLSTTSIFGSELFDNPALNFEPNLKLATPVNYILGPGDELQISVYGVQEFNSVAAVTPEGTVNIQYVGQIPVAGMTIEAATQKIKNAFAKIYSTVRSGQSKLSVSLSRIRTINVTIIGSKLPGNYAVSSFSSVYNALFLAGGPSANGSYRNIELLRNNKLINTVDIYQFLVNGNQSGNIGLKDNDVIRIPAYSHRVTVDGQVKRAGIFEMKAGETFTDLLSFASGFNDVAYTASVNVVQKTGKEFKVKDLSSAEYKTYQPQAGDVFKVAEILNRFENRVKIEGAVFRPETYSFYEGMRISDLIAKADGLKEDAYSKRAIIVRLKPDLTTEVVNVDLSKALNGDQEANILLKKEDLVTIYSILDFKEEYMVTINGEIKIPGQYQFREKITLNDLLIQAGGLIGSASRKVEIARMIKSEEIDDANPQKVEIFNLDIDVAGNEQIKNFELKPFDVINIRKMGVYEKPQMVSISGAVAYAGIYVLANKNERVLDIVKRAGGLTSIANVEGVKIKRPIQASQIEQLENVDVKLGRGDTIQNKLTKKLKDNLKYATIPVDWKKIMEDPNSNTNISLFAGDEIEVAQKNESVKVTGNVLLTSEIPFEKGKGFNYYIDAVGGLDSKAWKKKSYIIYPNGKAAVATSFLFFKSYPKVIAGSQIVIPERPESKKLTVGEIVSISSVLVGMAGVVIAIMRY
jgi:protein involved in polysaccharide export with SLBB domain